MHPHLRRLAIATLTTSLAAGFLRAGRTAGRQVYPETPRTFGNQSCAQSSGDHLADNSDRTSTTSDTAARPTVLNSVYRDESHCLTVADMRGDQDKETSCHCRDAIVDARYVYFTYLHNDSNLTGVFLAMVDRIKQQCGRAWGVSLEIAEDEDWKWDGPEVVRTYPSEHAASPTDAERLGGQARGRSIPFTVQLIFRDGKGHITRTEKYSSTEMIPEFK